MMVVVYVPPTNPLNVDRLIADRRDLKVDGIRYQVRWRNILEKYLSNERTNPTLLDTLTYDVDAPSQIKKPKLTIR